MKIDVDEQDVSQLLEGSTSIFRVPDYQRPYSWGISQLDDFWSDVQSLEDEDTHFLGSLVLIADAHKISGFNKIEVVDGQQRLTTLSLLLDAMHDRYQELGDNETAESLEKFLYSSMLKRGRHIKLEHGKIDRKAYKEIIENEELAQRDNNVYKTYNYFRNELKNLENEALDKLLEKVAYRLNFVTITTDSHNSAYRLFETLNDRGLDLSAVDLIKNYILKLASQNTHKFENIKLAWEEIIDNLANIDKVRFFRQYIMSTSLYETRKKVTKEQVYDRFVEIADKAGKDLDKLVDDVCKQSELYRKINNSEVDLFDVSRNIEVNECLRNLAAIKATTSYTLILRAFNELDRAEELIDLMRMIEIFSIRRSIVGASTSIIDPLYNSLALDAFQQTDWKNYILTSFSKNIPTNEEFTLQFQAATFQQNDQTKYILDKLETDGYGTGNSGKRVTGRFNVHIEHIAPQSMENPEEWQGFVELSPEEKKEMTMNIGNLTILEKRPNIQASNSTFKLKKEFYSEESSDMKITHELLSYEKWGTDEIKVRAKKLAEKAAKIWQF
jgi:uncharacterized protein with ParB-like and HNH nuclease domain